MDPRIFFSRFSFTIYLNNNYPFHSNFSLFLCVNLKPLDIAKIRSGPLIRDFSSLFSIEFQSQRFPVFSIIAKPWLISMALAASSSSSSSDDLIVPNPIKFIAINGEDNLLEYTSGWRSTELVKSIGYKDCSSVALVGKLIYVVGGADKLCPTSRVVFYDMTTATTTQPFCLVQKQGPSLNSPKLNPTLLVMGSKLFAFSWQFGQEEPFPDPFPIFGEASPLVAPELPPIAEFLDTSSPLNVWCPLHSFPKLPSPWTKAHSSYSISSSAVQLNNQTLFLSIGRGFDIIGVYSICYNHSTDLWTNLKETPLPFVADGQFVDDICFGFPLGMDTHDRDYIASYKFSVDSNTNTFSWVTLATYSLLSNSTLTYFPVFFSFQPLSPNALTTIRAKLKDNPSSREIYSLELEVLKLLPPPLKVEEKQQQLQGTTHVHSTTTHTMYHRLRAIVGAYW
ncbi:uncharacterized protein LOC141612519 isoform X1 [Silene latifolia]|uniref:uncharacterized protein LOC141612519 isoform X1 n=1 Tax=Silene latifolia TaxID=37657 RepID=UPI003D784B1A